MRARQIAPLALVLALTATGFLVANHLAERDARRDAERSADVAAAEIRGRVEQAASLTESLRQFMLDAGGTGVTSDQFASNAYRWLSPAGFSAAAWVERVPDARRAAYERRIGQPIVTTDLQRAVVPARSHSAYLAATLVSGFSPMPVPGIDLSREPGMAAALARATRVDGVAATGVASANSGTGGLFLVAPAPNLVDRVLRPGYVVVFASDPALRSAAREAPTVQIAAAGTPTDATAGARTVTGTFTAAGRRFDVAVPREPVKGAAAVLPWMILAAGLVLAGLAAALGLSGARRARAQDELDRIFTLSPDVIAVADFHGRFTRVNPAAERILGYTQQELVTRPYSDFVHPEDRERTEAQAAAISRGKATLSFENRYVRRDGSLRILEWTSTPVVEDGLMYGVARDVTERREDELELARLAAEQAALRRVATLVAREASQEEVFRAIAEESGQLLGTDEIRMVRYEEDHLVVVGSAGEATDVFPLGTRHALADDSVAAQVSRTGRPARRDRYATAGGSIPESVRSIGIHSAVAAPIRVEGRLWGAITAATRREAPLPREAETRLGQFTELIATAIANTESHARAERLAEEQAALRRVATLVAKEASLADVFAKVAEEMASALGDVDCALFRDEGDGTGTVVAVWGAHVSAGFPPGTRLPIDGDGVIASVLREGRPWRIAEYTGVAGPIADRARALGTRSAVGCPIVVGGRTWGAMAASKYEGDGFPPETELRIAQFAELVATAIANAEARAEVERLAEEQAALRRVATLVAKGAPPGAVFDAVAAEMERVLDADQVMLSRYEPGDEVAVVANRGARASQEGESVTALVRRTERPARMENDDGAHGAAVGAPIVVDGRVWGVVVASWTGEEPPPADTEERMAQFAQLLDTAIANADSRDQLTASRARLLTEGDDARRRVVRDLHDGAQQRLVHTMLTLKLAQRALLAHDEDPESLIAEALEQAERCNTELRELAHGILPPVLTRGGLRGAVRSVVARLGLPVDVHVPTERFAPEIEASAYFMVAEALTNVVKHSHADHALVSAAVENGILHVEVRDNGIGGADADGHGLVGMADRVSALGGRLVVDSPPGGGTVVHATLALSAV